METVRKLYTTEVLMPAPDRTVHAVLEEIGLSPHEILLYKTALSLGPRPASILAKTIKVQRTRVYDLLISLQSRGLMETVERNKVRYYAASSPERLLSLLKARKSDVETRLHELEEILPSLSLETYSADSSIDSRTVRGIAPVKQALEELLEERCCIMAVGDIEQVLRTNIGTTTWARQYRDKRIAAGIMLQIAVEGAPDFLEEKSLLRETLFSPDIPTSVLALATDETLLILDFSQPP